ncbi:MAG: DNA internalization-related competence protein ComEC/Rec2 [Saccharofermentans sp.]|nr:DNA internalization-related competence protein ComEC/Rec2 [Saccharofermentans sp.]
MTGDLRQDKDDRYRKVLSRPLLIPALLMYLVCLISFCSAEFIKPWVIILCFAMSFCLLFIFKLLLKQDIRSGILLLYFSIGLLLACLALYINVSINKELNGVPYALTVTRVARNLDGSIKLEAVTGSGVKVMVIPEGICDACEGCTIKISGDIEEPGGSRNPGQFSYASYLRRKGINYVCFADKVETIDYRHSPLSVLYEAVFSLRLKILEHLTEYDETQKALIAAVCLGDRSFIEDNVMYGFKMCDCSHILAVSGMHFAGFLFALPYIFKALGLGRRKAILVYILFVVTVGLITGFGESVTRAAVMSSCSFADRDRVSAMSLAVILMLLANPFAAVSTGFMMSFASCIAIVCLSEKTEALLRRIHFPKVLREAISPALCSSFGMIPFWDMTSYRLSPVLFIVQLLAGFICQFCCIFFVPCLITGISSPLSLMLYVLEKLMQKGTAIAVFASYPASMLKGLVLCIFFLAMLLLLPTCFAKRILFKPSVLLLAVITGFTVFKFINRPLATIVFADVGQGDCCLIMTGDKTCLIDGGIYEEGEQTVRDLLDYYGIDQVDYAFMSHWDTDHAAGLVALVRQNRIKALYTGFNGEDEDVSDFLTALELDESFLSGLCLTGKGDVFDLGYGVSLEVLYPEVNTGGGNEASLVMELNCGDLSVLYTGDIGFETEESLVNSGLVSDVDILKVAHHGSRFSTSDVFLDCVKPETAVISVGEDNFYGHPSGETLARLEARGIRVLRTDLMGAVIIEAR